MNRRFRRRTVACAMTAFCCCAGALAPPQAARAQTIDSVIGAQAIDAIIRADQSSAYNTHIDVVLQSLLVDAVAVRLLTLANVRYLALADPTRDVLYIGTVNYGSGAVNTGYTIPFPGAYWILDCDINNDGYPDLVVPNKFGNFISVATGNKDGSFKLPISYLTGNAPHGAASGDLNGDTFDDLIVANSGSNSVTLLFNNGDGTFANQVSLPAGNSPEAVCSGLFGYKTRTGFKDFVVLNHGDNTVSSYLNNTLGQLKLAGTFATGKGPAACVTGDFNRDGKLDLAVANDGDGTVSVFMGNGDGTFQPQVSYAVGPGARSMVASDFTGLSYRDLAVASSDGNVYLLGGRGDGTFAAAVVQSAGGGALNGIAAEDVNGDGRPDIFVVRNNMTVSVLANQGGMFAPRTGWWWNPNEGGRGFTAERSGNNLFMAAYLYDGSGNTSWYGINGSMSGDSYTGTLTSYANGQTLTGAWQPASVVGPAGNVNITFTSPTQATMTWPGGTIPLQKYRFAMRGSNTVRQDWTPEAGWWWAPSEGGRGFAFEIQDNMMFLAGYMYDSSGKPVWFASGPTAMSNATTYQSSWLQYGNGQTLTGTWHLPQVLNTNVGALTIQFTSTTTATLTLPTGRQVAIERFRF